MQIPSGDTPACLRLLRSSSDAPFLRATTKDCSRRPQNHLRTRNPDRSGFLFLKCFRSRLEQLRISALYNIAAHDDEEEDAHAENVKNRPISNG